ncbi:MAG: PAS domain S-box protein [Burkholderiales bacterium]|nr:PAS domain S-box protein [Burkholderiales bacterium]
MTSTLKPEAAAPGAAQPHLTSNTGPDSADLEDCLEISPHALLMLDDAGRVLHSNAVMREMSGGVRSRVADLPVAVQQLMGWPTDMPPAGRNRQVSGWVEGENGRKHRLQVKVRGLSPRQGHQRWIAQFEDRSLEDERDLARVEIAALMGDAEVGLATWDSAQGWVAPPPPLRSVKAGQPPRQQDSAALKSIGSELVEPESRADYDRLQQALRKRERVEVRYAVRHPDTGLRWLMTRVEPAELAPGRPVFSVMTLDVSQEEIARRRNEQLLRELSTILEVSPAGIAYLRGAELVRCNRRFETLLHLGEGEAIGGTLESLLARGGVPALEVHQALHTLDSQGSCETEFRIEASTAPVCYSLALRRSTRPQDGGEETVAVLTDVTGMRTQQVELEGLARERELMFSLSDVGIVYLRDGCIARANQAMAQLMGMDHTQLQGQPASLLFEDEAAYQRQRLGEQQELAASGRVSSERRLRRGDGTPLWVLASQRLVDSKNPAAGSICSFVSVDERKRARELVMVQADRTRAILDSVLVGIITVGDAGIEWMNRSARRMFGGELADFIGQSIAVVATADPEHPLRRTDWLTTLEEGQAETFECRLKARDGREFWVVGNVVITGRESAARQLTFALLDIDSRRRAEVQIAQARASLQRIIETAPLAIALFDARDQRVLQLNQMMAEFARRPFEQILNRDPRRWLPAAEADVLCADLQHATTKHEAVHRELLREAEPDTLASAWDVRIVSLQASAEAPEQLLLVASDVTEQRAADQARLDAAIAQREMLVKEVHHRIKNNLQGVAGLLQQNAQRHPEAATAIAEAVGHVHAIAQVHGLQVGMTGPLRVRGVVEAIASSVQRMFGRSISVTIIGPAPHRFGLTEADSIPVALTVNELLTNAIKHSDTGDIGCAMLCAEGEVAIAISNIGELPAGFVLANVPAGISGLGLVRALLPRKGAAMALEQQGSGRVVATLRLQPPAVAVLGPL